MSPRLSIGEETLALHIRALRDEGVLAADSRFWEREYRFDATRNWRFDFAWPGRKIAIEVDGVTRGRRIGSHQRCDGLARQNEKQNAATEAGWRVFRFTPPQIRSGYAAALIARVLKKEAPECRTTP